jgi:hypothetical protein
MKNLIDTLIDSIVLKDPGVIGCRRRNVWTDQQNSWQFLRGGAILAAVGELHEVEFHAGVFEFYVHDNCLLQFRGGPWRTYWIEDFYDAWAVASTFGPELDRQIRVFHESAGDIVVIDVDVPVHITPQARTLSIISELESDPPGRIRKSGERAMRVCRYCPVKARCDAADTLRGDTQDWSPSYRSLT